MCILSWLTCACGGCIHPRWWLCVSAGHIQPRRWSRPCPDCVWDEDSGPSAPGRHPGPAQRRREAADWPLLISSSQLTLTQVTQGRHHLNSFILSLSGKRFILYYLLLEWDHFVWDLRKSVSYPYRSSSKYSSSNYKSTGLIDDKMTRYISNNV